MRRSSVKTRSWAVPASPGACARTAAAVSGSISKPSSVARRATRSVRRGSATNASALTIRRRLWSRSLAPPWGSTSSPPPSGSAIALTVRSRAARSASSEPPCSGVMSTCQLRSRATTRQAPNWSESSNEAPPAPRPEAARGAAHVAVDDDVEVGRRAAQQPVAQRAARRATRAPRPAPRAASRSQRHPVAVVLARHARRQRARDLVVDGAQPPRHLLGRQARADEQRLVAALRRRRRRGRGRGRRCPSTRCRRAGSAAPPTSSSALLVSARLTPSP